VQTGEEAVEPLEGHTGLILSMAFSPDGTRIASGSYDMTIRIWDTKTGEGVVEPLEGHTDSVSSLAF
jgi:WD40 repeat protein